MISINARDDHTPYIICEIDGERFTRDYPEFQNVAELYEMIREQFGLAPDVDVWMWATENLIYDGKELRLAVPA